MPATDISPLAKLCKSALTDLIKDYHASPSDQAWVEVQLARFNLWAESLGVFAEQELSIAYRLAQNTQITTLTLQLLTALKGNAYLHHCAITGQEPQSQAKPAANEDDTSSSDSDDSSASEDLDARTKQRKIRIQDGLGRLGQLAVRLRREGAQRSADKAAKHVPLDERGEPLLPSFDEYVKLSMRRTFDSMRDMTLNRLTAMPDEAMVRPPSIKFDTEEEERYLIPGFLRDRLHRTVINRWRRICYQRHHATGLAGPITKTATEIQPLKMPTAGQQLKASGHDLMRPSQGIAKPPQRPVIGNRAPSAATVTPEALVIDPKADLQPKPAGTINTKIRAGDLSFPSAPKFTKGVELFKCPFCCLPQPVQLAQRKDKWQLHVMQDLAPYFCLIEDCSQAMDTYKTSDDWLTHLKTYHAHSSWSCNACEGKQRSTFKDPSLYRQHLDEVHAKENIGDRDIALLIDGRRQMVAPVWLQCLFCGFVPEEYLDEPETTECQQAIVDHMCKEHMQYYALQSMPWDIPGADGDDEYRLSRFTNSNSAKRSIMEDSGLISNELDTEEQQRLDDDPSLRRYLSTKENAGAASFQEIKVRFPAPNRDASLPMIVERWLEAHMKPYVDVSLEPTFEVAPLRRRSTQLVSPATIIDTTSQDAPKLLDEPETNHYIGDAAQEDQEDENGDAIGESKTAEAAKRLFELCHSGDARMLQQYLKELSPSVLTLADDRGVYEGFTALHHAILAGSSACVRLLVAAGCPTSQSAPSVGPPLALAALLRKHKLVEMLLQLGIQPSAVGVTYEHGSPLTMACASGSIESVDAILDRGVDVRLSAFFDAKVWETTFTALLPFMNHLPDEPDRAVYQKRVNVSEQLMSIEGPPLLIAILFGHQSLVKRLLARGADITARSGCVWLGIGFSYDSDDVVMETAQTLTASFLGKENMATFLLEMALILSCVAV